jgi:hypothetical protein
VVWPRGADPLAIYAPRIPLSASDFNSSHLSPIKHPSTPHIMAFIRPYQPSDFEAAAHIVCLPRGPMSTQLTLTVPRHAPRVPVPLTRSIPPRAIHLDSPVHDSLTGDMPCA